jgi:hypothetical protein
MRLRVDRLRPCRHLITAVGTDTSRPAYRPERTRCRAAPTGSTRSSTMAAGCRSPGSSIHCRGYDWSGRYLSLHAHGEAVVCGSDGVAVFDALHRRGTVSEAMLYAFEPSGARRRGPPAPYRWATVQGDGARFRASRNYFAENTAARSLMPAPQRSPNGGSRMVTTTPAAARGSPGNLSAPGFRADALSLCPLRARPSYPSAIFLTIRRLGTIVQMTLAEFTSAR